VTITGAQLAAETEWMRDQFEADRLAAELDCEVTPHPQHFSVGAVGTIAP
jgi:hypothetical protein